MVIIAKKSLSITNIDRLLLKVDVLEEVDKMGKVLVENNPFFDVTILNAGRIDELKQDLLSVIGSQISISEKARLVNQQICEFKPFLDFLGQSGVENIQILNGVLSKLNPSLKNQDSASRNQQMLVDGKFKLADLEQLDFLMNNNSSSLFQIIGLYQFGKIEFSVKMCISEWINLLEILEIISCFSQGESKLPQLKEILLKRIRKNIVLDDIIFYSNIANIIVDTEDHKPMTHRQIDIAAGKKVQLWLKLKENNPEMFLKFFRSQIIQSCLDFMGEEKLLNIHLQEIADSLGFASGCRGFGQIYHYQKDESGKVTIKPQIQFI